MIEAIAEWLKNHQSLLWYGGVGSVAVFVVSILAIPPIIVRIDENYFTHAKRPPRWWSKLHPVPRYSISAAKNLCGVVLMVLGLAMLVLPGQGVLTMLAGFLLIDFPGKYKLEKRLVAQPWILRPINWLRRRRNCPPLRTKREF
jgi:hypothetical protein